jgi:hemoglobin
MEYNITKAYYGRREPVKMLSRDILAFLGEEGVRKLISDHYDLLIESEIKALFPRKPEALEAAKKNSADFFIQLMGGPDYFNQNRGAPMMARRHAPFRITPEARIVWLECYAEVIEKSPLSEHLKESYWGYVDTFSTWMINKQSKESDQGFVFES